MLKTIKYPNGVLSRPTAPLERPLSEELLLMQDAADMLSLAKQERGYGVTHNQLKDPAKRFFVVDSEKLEGVDRTQECVVNPVLSPIEEEGTSVEPEGCLSLPGIYVTVARWNAVRAKFQDTLGNEIELVLRGLTARVFQHEVDHLDGKTIFDRTSVKERARARAEAIRRKIRGVR